MFIILYNNNKLYNICCKKLRFFFESFQKILNFEKAALSAGNYNIIIIIKRMNLDVLSSDSPAPSYEGHPNPRHVQIYILLSLSFQLFN